MRPFLVFLQVTDRCNLDCVFCASRPPRKAPPYEFTTGRAFLLVDEIARLGARVLVVRGGEPLLRSDVFDLLEFARFRGLAAVLETNATLVDIPAAKELRRVGIRFALVGLEGPDAASHDRVRGHAGLFDKIEQGLGRLRGEGVPFRIATVARPGGGTDLAAMAATAERLGARELRVYADFPFPCAAGERGAQGGGGFDTARLAADLRRASRPGLTVTLARAPGLAAELEGSAVQLFPCSAGREMAAIEADGTVLPCPYHPASLGNVRERPLCEILRDAAAPPCGEGPLRCPALHPLNP